MEKLTILNPKSINMNGVGGIPELTAADLAACCSNANNAGFLLLVAQVCGSYNFSMVFNEFWPETEKLAKRLKWRMREKDKETLKKFLEMLLIDSIFSEKCPSCRGTKYSLINPSEKCPTCGGSGQPLTFDFKKAEYIGITKQSYSETWLEREDEVKALFDRRTYQVVQSIKNLQYESLT